MQTIVFLTEFDLNNRSGSSFNRIIELSKAFCLATGKSVYITSLTMDNMSPVEIKFNEEVPINAIGKTKNNSKDFFTKRYLLHKEKFRELKRIVCYFENKDIKPVFVIYNFFSSFYDQIVFTKYIKNKGFKVISEKNELALASAKIRSYPKGIINKVIFSIFHLIEMINGFYIDRYLKNFDGFITINENHKKYIQHKEPDTPVLKIPILYSKSTHENFDVNSGNQKFKIGYFGTINFKRDKIDVVLKGLDILKSKYQMSNIIFTIGGKASRHQEAKLKNMIKRYELNKIVKYVGYLSKDELNIQLKNQSVLLALRNNNLQGKYSFATKIAMYMHLGKIPLVSDVSDNNVYIKNNVNGFILKKTDASELAKLLHEIAKMDKKTLSMISNEAKQTALEHFSYNAYVEVLKVFLDEI
ncbi:MAG: glycosyltransferase [Candidatus Woesearchaeota archaeon]